MSIVRAPRPESAFYVLDKQISEDKRLSWAARGLLVFLLGKPDHWRVSVKNLVNETKGAVGRSTGRDAVYGLLAELQTVGYLRRAGQTRGDGGKMAEAEYLVHEVPVAAPPCPEKPYTADPSTAEPSTAEPHSAKPTQASTDEKQELNSSKDGAEQADAGAPAVVSALKASDLEGDGVSADVAAEFLMLRRKRKAQLTPLAWKGIKREAAKAGWSLEAVLTRCVERGWIGFEASWVTDAAPEPQARRDTEYNFADEVAA